MKRHPEQQRGEKLLGNFAKEGYRLLKWKSKRMGEVAYCSDGETPIPAAYGLFPVFVQLSEVEESE